MSMFSNGKGNDKMQTNNKDNDSAGPVKIKLRELEWFEVETMVRQLVRQLVEPHLKKMNSDRSKVDMAEMMKIQLETKMIEVEKLIGQNGQSTDTLKSAELRFRAIEPTIENARFKVEMLEEGMEKKLKGIEQDLRRIFQEQEQTRKQMDEDKHIILKYDEKAQEYRLHQGKRADQDRQMILQFREESKKEFQKSNLAIDDLQKNEEIMKDQQKADHAAIVYLQAKSDEYEKQIASMKNSIDYLVNNMRKIDEADEKYRKAQNQIVNFEVKLYDLAEYIDKHIPLNVYSQISEMIFACITPEKHKALMQQDEIELRVLNERIAESSLLRQNQLETINFQSSQEFFGEKLLNIAKRNKAFKFINVTKELIEEREHQSQEQSQNKSRGEYSQNKSREESSNSQSPQEKLSKNQSQDKDKGKIKKGLLNMQIPTIEELILKELESEEFTEIIQNIISQKMEEYQKEFDTLSQTYKNKLIKIQEESEMNLENQIKEVEEERERLANMRRNYTRREDCLAEGLSIVEQFTQERRQKDDQIEEQIEATKKNISLIAYCLSAQTSITAPLQQVTNVSDQQPQNTITKNEIEELKKIALGRKRYRANSTSKQLNRNQTSSKNSKKESPPSSQQIELNIVNSKDNASHRMKFVQSSSPVSSVIIPYNQIGIERSKDSLTSENNSPYNSSRQEISIQSKIRNQSNLLKLKQSQINQEQQQQFKQTQQYSLDLSSNISLQESKMQPMNRSFAGGESLTSRQKYNNQQGTKVDLNQTYQSESNSSHFSKANFIQQSPLALFLPKMRRITAQKSQPPKTADSNLSSARTSDKSQLLVKNTNIQPV